MNNYNFNSKLFITLTITFVLMTVVGTLTHEMGHYTTARLLGYDATINYKSSLAHNKKLFEYLHSISTKYSYELKNNIDFPEKANYHNTVKKYEHDSFLITLGGPLQTILTGSFGFLLLLRYRKKNIRENKVSITGWAFIFLSLFWLRQVANLFLSLASVVLTGKTPIHGDEFGIAKYLDLNPWSIQVSTGLIGIAILLAIVKIMPQKMLPTFLVSGLVGGSLGFYLWLVKFGQYIMP